MAKLTEGQKTFIVQRLACGDSPQEVADELKELFEVEIDRGQVGFYNPEYPKKGSPTPKKWAELYWATKKAWLEGKAKEGIADPMWRLRRRGKLFAKAEKVGNIPLALTILDSAAKEEGGAFTNRHKVQHSGQVKTTGVLVLPTTPDDWSKQARTQQQDLEQQAARAAEAGARG